MVDIQTDFFPSEDDYSSLWSIKRDLDVSVQSDRESLGVLPFDFEKSDSNFLLELSEPLYHERNIESNYSDKSRGCLNIDGTKMFDDKANSNLLSLNNISQICFNFDNKEQNISFVEDGRESLGILPLNFELSSNFLNTSGSQSLNFKNILYLDNSEVEQESLGILQLDNLDIAFTHETEKLSEEADKYNIANVLDSTFISLSPKKSLNLNSNMAFNNPLKCSSKIYSLTDSSFSISSKSCNKSVLNNAMYGTPPEIHSSLSFLAHPLRTIDKLKAQSHVSSRTLCLTDTKCFTETLVSNPLESVKNKEDSITSPLLLEQHSYDKDIDDEMFFTIEVSEHGILDSTPQPEWPDESELKNKESPKAETEDVLKTIDKLFPISLPAEPEIDDLESRSAKTSSTPRKSNAKEILQNLTQIFKSSRRSDLQKSEGRHLLNTLVDLLDISQISQEFEDSGNSSILENSCGNVPNTTKETEGRHSEPSPQKRLSSSLGPSKTGPQKLERSSSLSSISNKVKHLRKPVQSDEKQSGVLGTKLKLKSVIAEKPKGPMKAMIPVENMKKIQARFSTPEIATRTSTRSNKIRTPSLELQPRPLAASTPSFSNIESNTPKMPGKALPRRTNSLDNKREAAANKNSKQYIPRTSFLKNPSLESKQPRRHSIDQKLVCKEPLLKRSSSLGREKINKNLDNQVKPVSYKKKTGILTENNTKTGPITGKPLVLKI